MERKLWVVGRQRREGREGRWGKMCVACGVVGRTKEACEQARARGKESTKMPKRIAEESVCGGVLKGKFMTGEKEAQRQGTTVS